jgi:hypothetical protein
MAFIFLLLALVLSILASAGFSQFGGGSIHFATFPAAFACFICSVLCGMNWRLPSKGA